VEVTLKAEPRSGTGKGVAHKLRAVGKIPAVLYGHGIEAVPVAVDQRALANALSTEAGRNVLIDLEVNGESHLTLARELQRDVLRGTLIHADFLKISRDQTIEVDVPIHVVGESIGVKEGGVVEHHLWNIKLACKPGNVPERLDVDVTNLALGDRFLVQDLVLPPDVEILNDPEEAILAVVVPQVLKLEEEVPAEAVAEGEEGAVPVEGEEGAAPPAEGAEKGE
jgi:large subunit ribosomal protein L25